jgi:hypothetical protein
VLKTYPIDQSFDELELNGRLWETPTSGRRNPQRLATEACSRSSASIAVSNRLRLEGRLRRSRRRRLRLEGRLHGHTALAARHGASERASRVVPGSPSAGCEAEGRRDSGGRRPHTRHRDRASSHLRAMSGPLVGSGRDERGRPGRRRQQLVANFWLLLVTRKSQKVSQKMATQSLPACSGAIRLRRRAAATSPLVTETGINSQVGVR